MIVFVVGPTAAGKTEYAVELCRGLDGEVVTLDSRQWYRGMDIGTAKPSRDERGGIPHHLLDVADPDDTVSLAAALDLIRAACHEVEDRGRAAVLTGGTGQYVRALIEGWVVPKVAPDMDRRTEMEVLAHDQGPAVLHHRLAAVDPVAAERIGPSNTRRLIRALEVFHGTGEPITEWQRRRTDPIVGPVLGLAPPPAELHRRIAERVDRMLEAGLEREVRTLTESGYGFDLPAMSAVGYGEWRDYLRGEGDRSGVREAIVLNTRRLVRKQSTWFARPELGVQWLDEPLVAIARPAMPGAG